ncbi:Citrate transporter superfamily [Verrucomicrobiia bacterium DG1235]|nr:Citrate transporter superfamily [Verrucomicrobiae bacterium DG1235]
MTLQIALVLGILLAALILFIAEKVRMDVTALLVLVALAFTGIIEPTEAISGFANPAVITVWAMFILSEGLAQTGVASIIGVHVLKFTGKTESRMIFVIMLTSGVLSALMNNIGVAALMLPVVLNVARQTGVSPSKLLMPLAYGSLLGGLTTLIGTPPNLLISNALAREGYTPFGLFDFTPIGLVVMLAGVAFVALASRLLLPDNGPAANLTGGADAKALFKEYQLGERSFFVRLLPKSTLAGATLRESRLGKALGLRVVALQRGGEAHFSPGPDFVLASGDSLFIQGRVERLNELKSWQELQAEKIASDSGTLLSPDTLLVEANIPPESELAGQTIRQLDFRKRFGLNILLIRQTGSTRENDVASATLQVGDRLVLQGRIHRIEAIREDPNFTQVENASEQDLQRYGDIAQRLFEVTVPPASWLADKPLHESELRRSFDLHVLKIQRQSGEEILLPEPDEKIRAGDRLTLHGRLEDLSIIKSLQSLEMRFSEKEEAELLESGNVGLAEATFSPKSQLPGNTPAEIDFQARFGVQLLSIMRAARSYRSNLANVALHHGDSFLLMGPREKLDQLQTEKDFIILSQVEKRSYRSDKAILSSAIMLAVLVPVFFGWFPIAITAIAGAMLMVLTGCLKMEDAYAAIEWKSVFLIAGMLPLGLAIERSGAAELLAQGVLSSVGGYGPWVVIGALYLITAAATTIIPTAALVVLMAPIVIKSCNDLGIPPQTGMMAIAMAASASFTSPISHPANILVMGPGGYRFIDYIKVGAPLAIIVFIVVMLALPFFWPI